MIAGQWVRSSSQTYDLLLGLICSILIGPDISIIADKLFVNVRKWGLTSEIHWLCCVVVVSVQMWDRWMDRLIEFLSSYQSQKMLQRCGKGQIDRISCLCFFPLSSCREHSKWFCTLDQFCIICLSSLSASFRSLCLLGMDDLWTSCISLSKPLSQQTLVHPFCPFGGDELFEGTYLLIFHSSGIVLQIWDITFTFFNIMIL